ncbi:MAG TPA: hypothetical protein VEL11_00315 [Candidatus Bathyarchaeia archaeon]|nr:hypothetical protein [Candidatus Bathyarchaeia archaeon]
MPNIDAFLIDFVTTDFESDSKIAKEVLIELQKVCNLDNHDSDFVLDSPMYRAGWYFAKLFLSKEFAKRLYNLNLNEIDNLKGKKFEDNFISWLSIKFKSKKCEAQLKTASEMK